MFLGLPVVIALAVSLAASYLKWRLSPRQKIEGTRANLEAPRSDTGVFIPIVYGCGKVSGNIIWAAPVKEKKKKKKQGKGAKSSTTTYTYTGSAAYLICRGEICNISRIWLNGELKYNILESASDEDFENSVEFRNKYMNIYGGSSNQNPDSTKQEYLGSDIPAYREMVYIVFTDLDLTAEGGRYPQVECEVIQTGDNLSNGRVRIFPISIEVIIKSLGALAGIPSDKINCVEVNNWKIWGYYITSPSDIRDMLRNLTALFPFYAVEYDGVLYCRRRDRPVVSANIPKYYLAARQDSEDRPVDFSLTRADPVQIPSSIELTVMDRSRDYESAVLTYRSATATNNNVETLNLPIAVDIKIAEIAAIRILRELIQSREKIDLLLPPSFLFLEPGDIISVEAGFQMRLFTISQINIGAALILEVEAIAYAANIYGSKIALLPSAA